MPWNKVMSKFGAGTLHSGGPSGPTVTSHAQAVAIMMSEKAKAKAGKSYDNGGIVPKDGQINVKKGELVVPADHPAFKQILALFESADTETKDDQGGPPAGPPARPGLGMTTQAPPSSIAGG